MSKGMELITVVVQRKDGQRAIDTALKAGAPGVTTFYGRGTGVRQKFKLLGLFIEAEKQFPTSRRLTPTTPDPSDHPARPPGEALENSVKIRRFLVL